MLRLPQRNKQASASTVTQRCLLASQHVQGATSGPGAAPAAGHRQQQRPHVLITPLSKAIEPVSPRCIEFTHISDSKPINRAAPAAHHCTACSKTSNAEVPAAGAAKTAAGVTAAAEATAASQAAVAPAAAEACGAPSHASEPSCAAVPIAHEAASAADPAAPGGHKEAPCQQQQQPVSDDGQVSSSPEPVSAAAASEHKSAIPKTPFYVYTQTPLCPTPAEEAAPHPTHKLVPGKNGRPKVKPTKYSSIQLCRQQSLTPTDAAAATAQHSTPAQHQHQPKPSSAHCSHFGTSYQLPSALDATLLNINRTWLEAKARDIKVVAAFSGAAVFSPPGSDDGAIASAVLSLLQEVARASQLRIRHRALQMLQRFREPQCTGLPPAAPLARIVHLTTPPKRAQSSAPTLAGSGVAAVQAVTQAVPATAQQPADGEEAVLDEAAAAASRDILRARSSTAASARAAAVRTLSVGGPQLAALEAAFDEAAAAAAAASHSCGDTTSSKPQPASSSSDTAHAAAAAAAAVNASANAAQAAAAAVGSPTVAAAPGAALCSAGRGHAALAVAALDSGSGAAPAAAALDRASSNRAPSLHTASLAYSNTRSASGSSSRLTPAPGLGLQHVLSDGWTAATGLAGGSSSSSCLDRPVGARPAALLTLLDDSYCTSQPDTPSSFAGSHALSSCSGTISSSEDGELNRPSYISSGGCSSNGGAVPAGAAENMARAGAGVNAGVDPYANVVQQGCASKFAQRLQLQPLVTVSACSSGSALSGNGGAKAAKPRGMKGWWRRVREWGQGAKLGLRGGSRRLAAQHAA